MVKAAEIIGQTEQQSDIQARENRVQVTDGQAGMTLIEYLEQQIGGTDRACFNFDKNLLSYM